MFFLLFCAFQSWKDLIFRCKLFQSWIMCSSANFFKFFLNFRVLDAASRTAFILISVPGLLTCRPCDCKRHRSKFITQEFTLNFMREVCRIYGGYSRFGFHPTEIGNKSIRSGAAMALFLTDHSSDKIMILGRWKSKAFLDYIRPQIVEWVELFSDDMISFNNFFELCSISSRNKNHPDPEQHRGHYDLPAMIVA